MARGVNKVTLIGHLGKDPEVRYTAGGSAVANIRVATTEQWRDKQTGQTQERTEWHAVVLFNRLGEIAGEYLRKGSQVYIEGKLQTRKWQDNSGQDRYTTEIVAGELVLLGGRSGAGGPPPMDPGGPDGGGGGGGAPAPSRGPAGGGGGGGGGRPSGGSNFDDFDDDIPF